ncbi:serine/arginine-rich splicing factor SC35, partial [Tanacetum coccineum]
NGDSRGFAFVRYKYSDEAQKAMDRLDVIEEGSLRSLTLPGAEVVVGHICPMNLTRKRNVHICSWRDSLVFALPVAFVEGRYSSEVLHKNNTVTNLYYLNQIAFQMWMLLKGMFMAKLAVCSPGHVPRSIVSEAGAVAIFSEIMLEFQMIGRPCDDRDDGAGVLTKGERI